MAMLGAKCSKCCDGGGGGGGGGEACTCIQGTLPDVVTVTLEGTGQTQGPPMLGLKITSCFGSGATGTVDATGTSGDTRGPITSAAVTAGGSGYAALGREPPTITLGNANTKAADVSFSYTQSSDKCGRPLWSISDVAVIDGGDGYTNAQPASFALAADTRGSGAFGTIYTQRAEPVLEASATSGSGVTFTVNVEETGAEPPTWRVESVTFKGEGSNFVDGEMLSFVGTGVVTLAAAQAVVRATHSESPPAVQVVQAIAAGEGASLSVTLSRNIGDPPTWSVASVSIDAAGTGYGEGDLFQVYNTDTGGFVAIYVNVAAVGENGEITAVTIEQYATLPGASELDSVDVLSGGEYYGTTKIIDRIELANGGSYYAENTKLPAIVSDINITIQQAVAGGAGGSGAVLSAVVDTNTASATFGSITAISVINGGNGYRAWAWQYSCDCEWVAGEEAGSSYTVVAWRFYDLGLTPTCIYSAPRCYPNAAELTRTVTIPRRVKPPDTAGLSVPGPGLGGGTPASGGLLRFQWTQTVIDGALVAWTLDSVSVENAGTGYTNGSSFGVSGFWPPIAGTLTANGNGAIQSVAVPTGSAHWAEDGTTQITVPNVPETADSLVLVRLSSDLKTAWVALSAPAGVPGRDDGPISRVSDTTTSSNALSGWATMDEENGTVHAPAVTATIEQALPSQGSGAAVAVQVDRNPYSPTFGRLTITLTNRGDGYLGGWVGSGSIVVRHRGNSLPPVVETPDGNCVMTYIAAGPILDCDDFSFVASFGDATATVEPGGDVTTMFRGSPKCCGLCYNACPDYSSQVTVTLSRPSATGKALKRSNQIQQGDQTNCEGEYPELPYTFGCNFNQFDFEGEGFEVECPEESFEVVFDIEDLEYENECDVSVCVGPKYEATCGHPQEQQEATISSPERLVTMWNGFDPDPYPERWSMTLARAISPLGGGLAGQGTVPPETVSAKANIKIFRASRCQSPFSLRIEMTSEWRGAGLSGFYGGVNEKTTIYRQDFPTAPGECDGVVSETCANYESWPKTEENVPVMPAEGFPGTVPDEATDVGSLYWGGVSFFGQISTTDVEVIPASGTTGTGASLSVDLLPNGGDPPNYSVASASIGAAGTGYAVGDSFHVVYADSLTDPPDWDSIVRTGVSLAVDAVGQNGNITAVRIRPGGGAARTPDVQVVQPGGFASGTGASLSVTLSPGNFPLWNVESASIDAAGTDYEVGDLFYVSDVSLVVDDVGPDGEITAVTIQQPGGGRGVRSTPDATFALLLERVCPHYELDVEFS